jgi:uncharacterized protein
MNSDISSSENDVSSICVSCGMCCDGTLFDKAVVHGEEDRAVADGVGLTTYVINDKSFFKLPCHHFSACCTIYGTQRPHTCSAFFCVPLKKYKSGEQTFSDAAFQVQQLLEYRNSLMKAAAQFPELMELNFRQIKSKLEEYSEDNDKVRVYRHLFLIFFLFENARKSYFKVTRKDDGVLNY